MASPSSVLPRKRSKSNMYCCVPNCKTYYSDKVSFHNFPRTGTLLRCKWIDALQIKRKVSPYMRVCNKHFKDEDFFFNRCHVNKMYRLKVNVVPSRNLPVKLRLDRRPPEPVAIFLKEDPQALFPEEPHAYTCKFCQFTSTSMFAAVNHETGHFIAPETFNCAQSSVDQFACKDCSFTTLSSVSFKQHIQEKHSLEESDNFRSRTYVCKHCDFKTHSVLVLLRHIRGCYSGFAPSCTQASGGDLVVCSVGVLGGHEVRWFLCNLCEYKTAARSCYEEHVGDRHYVELTQKEATKRDPQVKRREKHSKKKIPWFECDECGYKSRYRSSLKTHLVLKHMENAP